MAATKDMQSSPFIRQLASSDKRIRDRALSSLRTYLQRKTAFDNAEIRKIWKGLFYCMWMSDKPRNQQLLAQDLADLLNVVAPINFLPFAEGFWTTMAAEWSNIDRLRVDKFLYLIRCYVNTGFEWLKKHKWGVEGQLDKYLDLLKTTPLDARDPKIPNGIRYHVIDIYVDELDKIDTANDAPIEELLSPLRELKRTSITKAVRNKVDEALDDDRLKDWPRRGDMADSADEVDGSDGENEDGSQQPRAAQDNGFDGFGD